MKRILFIYFITQVFFFTTSVLGQKVEINSPSLDDLIVSIENQYQENKIKKQTKKTQLNASDSRETVCTKSFRSNFRKGPNTTFPVEYEILVRGYPLKVIKYVDSWYAVEDFEGVISWISEINVKKNCGAMVKTPGLAFVYLKPSKDAKVMLSLERGFIIHELECWTQEWCRVTVENKKGWMQMQDLWGNL